MFTTTKSVPGFRQGLLALAIAAAFGSACAQGVDIEQLTAPGGTWVGVGVGGVTGDENDRARFGLFNGLREHSVYGLFDFQYFTADPATAYWTTVYGRNLGLDTREVGVVSRRLGDWKVFAEYSEIERQDPRTINTGLLGAGTTTPTVVRLATPGSGSDVNLDLKRKSITVGGAKWFNGMLQFEATFKNEDKDGARVWGRGFACSGTWVAAGSCASSTTQWALLMLPEPIDSSIRQAEAKLTYNGDKLLLVAGYYGSFYNNNNGTLTPGIPGVLNNPLGNPVNVDAGLRTTLGLPMALPPDNQAHQFSLDGNYRFTPTTVATFKYAYTHATQDADFLSAGLTGAPPERSNLGAELNTTLAQAGLSMRPFPKLALLANIRYEDKDNKTPIAYYNIEGKDVFTNGNPSPTKLNGKVEGSYALPAGFRGTVGVDYEKVDHGTFTPTDSLAGLSGIRQKTEEWGYRAELLRSISETLTGSISYSHARREGDSPWLKPQSLPATGVVEANDDPSCVPPPAPAFNNCIYRQTGIFPFIFEDRTRDKVKLMATWMPNERSSLQFWVEDGKDDYSGPSEKGLRDTDLRFYSVDAYYALTPAWKLTGYYSHGEQTINVAHSTGYVMALENTTDAFGAGLTGKASDRLQVGADLTWSRDKDRYNQGLDAAASAANQAFLAANGLPDVTFDLFRARLWGDYALQSNAFLRVNLIYEYTKLDEWTWGYNGVPFAYSDNTTISGQPKQEVGFIGVSYIYKWR